VREGFAPEAAKRELNLTTVALKRFPSDRIELYTAAQFLLPGGARTRREDLRRDGPRSGDGGAEPGPVLRDLNDVEAGGETAFVNVGLVIPPRQGTALLWNNLRADGGGNYDTLHHGMPVKAGCKAIITKWFRRPRWRTPPSPSPG